MENRITTIRPQTEGNYLTQKAPGSENSRIYVTSISGARINPDDWRDATPEEKEQWEREHQPEEETINEE